MFRARHDNQILGSVVTSIAVQMMDNFITPKGTPDSRFHYLTMLMPLMQLSIAFTSTAIAKNTPIIKARTARLLLA